MQEEAGSKSGRSQWQGRPRTNSSVKAQIGHQHAMVGAVVLNQARAQHRDVGRNQDVIDLVFANALSRIVVKIRSLVLTAV